MRTHKCSACGNEFQVTWRTRYVNSSRFLLPGIVNESWKYKFRLDYFSDVICPKCGHREKDVDVRWFGIFSNIQFGVIVIVLGIAYLVLTKVFG